MAIGATPKTALFANFQQGSLQVADQSLFAGQVMFTGAGVTGATNGTGYGRSPLAPFLTIGFGISQLTASQGDTLLVLPGHTQNLAGAAAIAASKAGTRILGIGTGRNRPVITWITGATSSWDITAANVTIENMCFDLTGVAAVTAGFNVQAADVTFRNCEFILANATNQAVLGILTTAAANRMTIDSCLFRGTTDAGTTAAVKIVGGDGIVIKNSLFFGAYGSAVGAIQQATTTTTNCLIANNVIQNYTANNTKALTFTASSTGQITGNALQILSNTAPITGAAMSWVGSPPNYYGNAVGAGSTIV